MKTDNIAALKTIDDDEKSVTNSVKVASKKSSRNSFSYWGALLLFVALLAGAAVGAYVLVNNSNSNKSSELQQQQQEIASSQSASESSSDEPCHLTIKDSHQPILEITLAAAHSETVVTETQAKEFEQAIISSYNDVSGGCSDEFKRWMYGINIIDQTVVEYAVMEKEAESSISHSFDNEYSVVLRLETMISCDGCNNDEAFASVYPTSFGNRASARHLIEGRFNTAEVYDRIEEFVEENLGTRISTLTLIATNADSSQIQYMSYYEGPVPVTDSATVPENSTVSWHEQYPNKNAKHCELATVDGFLLVFFVHHFSLILTDFHLFFPGFYSCSTV